MADGSIKFELEILDKKAKESLKDLEEQTKKASEVLGDDLTKPYHEFNEQWSKASSEYLKDISEMSRKTAEFGKDIRNNIDIDNLGIAFNKESIEKSIEELTVGKQLEKVFKEIDSSDLNKIKVNVDTDDINKYESNLKELDAITTNVGDSIDDKLTNSASNFINSWNRAKSKYEEIMNDMTSVNDDILKQTEKLAVIGAEEGVGSDQYIQEKEHLDNLILSQNKLVDNADMYAVRLEKISLKAGELTDKIAESNPTQQELVRLVEEHNQKLKESLELEEESNEKISIKEALLSSINSLSEGFKDSLSYISSSMKDSNNATQSTSKSAKGMGNSFKSSLKHVKQLTLAMLGMRGVVTGLNKITREWYNSNNLGARQAQANMQAMTTGITNLLAPALTFVSNILATIMGYINAISKAFFGVDLLSRKTAKNVGTGAKNAKKMGKEIKGFTASFDEADVASASMADNLDGGFGGGGAPDIDLDHNIKTPDLTHIKEALLEAFDPFIQTMKSIDFKPLEKAFKNLAKVGKQSAKIIGDSFVRVMNNSVAPFIKLLIEDIVPVGLNTVARILERLNPVIDRLLKDFVEPLIHWFLLDFVPVGLNLVFKVMEALGGILAVVIESFNEFWDSSIGRAISFVAGELVLAIMEDLTTIFNEIIESVDFFFEALEEGEPFATGLAWAIGLIVSALVAWKIAQAGVNAVTALFKAISPFGWLVIAITAVIAVILVLYKNWENIVEFFKETLAKIGQWFADRWQGIKDGFSNLVQSIKDWWNNTIQSLKDGWQSFLDKGRDVISGIRNFFTGMIDWLVSKTGFFGQYWSEIISGMLSGIKKVINNIKGVFRGFIDFITGVFTGDWKRAWTGVVNIFKNIVSGIANIFKTPINTMIRGINVFLRGLNKIKIPSWVPGVGGRGFNVPQIPQLRHGAVLTHQTTATMAEYPNARTNPELVTPEKKMRQVFNEEMSKLGNFGNDQPTVIVNKIYLEGRQIAEVVNEQNEEASFNLNGGNFAWNK